MTEKSQLAARYSDFYHKALERLKKYKGNKLREEAQKLDAS